MLKDFRTPLVFRIWFAVVTAVVVVSVAVGAAWSTTALVFAIGMAPIGIALMLGFGAPSMTIHEVLYAAENDKRG